MQALHLLIMKSPFLFLNLLGIQLNPSLTADIIKVRPEGSQSVQQFFVGVRKVFGINTVGNDKCLNVMIKSVIGMLFITHYLINSFFNINTSAF